MITALALAAAGAFFFDDFSQSRPQELAAQGWLLRTQVGHPGVVGARWDPAALTWVDDPERPGNRWLRLSARTDGTAAGTVQSQICRPQQFLWGTTAARVRFSPRRAGGDPVVQAVFQVSPLRFDYDPLFSELDWEYLPNGGWGSPTTRLFGVAWQTVRLEPWEAHNEQVEHPQELGGQWVQLTVQNTPQGSRWFLNDQALAQHAGRTITRQAMALSLSHWVSPGGLRSGGAVQAEAFDVDWVLHRADAVLQPGEMAAEVEHLRRAGQTRGDTLKATLQAPRCDF
ncbi:glycoside hydrolase family 16 protein [Inhella gelatinilytica]|uniref:Glycoside hydrolase family 16 protein n=1 Tax=Inhella gelatinilytica TaxID=2795030 RepID=A0A931J1C1_9BURK|nr:glycoside hydrolase family 16 protein [Inhella gelatinilytica]MBH9553703.1 glycoside hydrolase family 16 protein [Inhella gelatinilytica]